MRYEILDSSRIQRPHGRRGRRIEWRCSLRVRSRFRSLLHELVDLEQQPDEPETRQRMVALRQDILALPGFPRRFDPDHDLIVPVTTSAQR